MLHHMKAVIDNLGLWKYGLHNGGITRPHVNADFLYRQAFSNWIERCQGRNQVNLLMTVDNL